jgi:hypothetical protein
MNKYKYLNNFLPAEGTSKTKGHDQVAKGGNECSGQIRKLSRQASTLEGMKKESDRGFSLLHDPLL